MYILDAFDIPSKIGIINAPPQLNPWVELTVTCLFTIFSAIITIRAVQLSIENQEAQRKEDNEKTVLPMGKIEKLSIKNTKQEDDAVVSVISRCTKKYKTEKIPSFKYLRFRFKNVGIREMYNVSIQFINDDNFYESEKQKLAPIVYSNDTITIAIKIITQKPTIDKHTTIEKIGSNIAHPILPITFYIYYYDCYNNKYKQQFQVETIFEWFKIVDTNTSYKDFENPQLAGYKVLSAPKKEAN